MTIRMSADRYGAGAGKPAADRARERAVTAFEASGAELFAGRQVVDASLGTLQAWVGAEERLESFQFESLILSTGARERFLPFPGWTLPGVFGAGGLQALVRGGYDVRGKRVVVSGTGPLLLAVAAHLKQDGAEVVHDCRAGADTSAGRVRHKPAFAAREGVARHAATRGTE